jgi:hypothetical protein
MAGFMGSLNLPHKHGVAHFLEKKTVVGLICSVSFTFTCGCSDDAT